MSVSLSDADGGAEDELDSFGFGGLEDGEEVHLQSDRCLSVRNAGLLRAHPEVEGQIFAVVSRLGSGVMMTRAALGVNRRQPVGAAGMDGKVDGRNGEC